MSWVLDLMMGAAMANQGKWVTYGRFDRGVDKHHVTLLATEKRPMGFSTERPATKVEIAAEKRRRAEKKRYADRVIAFQSRPEYQDAQMIASTLELMDVDTNPLDRFTPNEWHDLRERICGK